METSTQKSIEFLQKLFLPKTIVRYFPKESKRDNHAAHLCPEGWLQLFVDVPVVLLLKNLNAKQAANCITLQVSTSITIAAAAATTAGAATAGAATASVASPTAVTATAA
jgi:hypothetical protein